MTEKAIDSKNIFSEVKKMPIKEKQKAYALTTCIDENLFYLSGMGSKIRVLENGEKRTLIDMSAGVSTKNIGYGNKRVMKIVREQTEVAGYPHHAIQIHNAPTVANVLTNPIPPKFQP